jgi:hypothetical protein
VLSLTAYGAAGATVVAPALPVPPLPPGGAAAVSTDLQLAGSAGAYTLVALVDPQGTVAEVGKGNNQASLAFALVGQGPPLLGVTTDRPAYSAGDDVTATIELWNGSAPLSGRLAMTIEDEQGAVVEALPALAATAST